ncbi:MAG TPA: DNA repair protein RadC [Planctomycetaceae bacterium]|nr:DNA repair protein RadC [Planctomycetaceae bacterium]HQZ67606.1 DNA repair protein RadC [Planctomycetaceae bacterium]
MPLVSKRDRKQIYQTVLSRLCARPEFAIEEIRESHGNEYSRVTLNIVAELVKQGNLQPVETAAGTRFRWKGDPQQFEVDPWVNAQVHGTQITESPLSERPRERLLLHGVSQLKLSELLAILIRTGRVGESALQAGERIATRLGERLETLPGLGRKELKEYSVAVTEPAYCQIMAGIELGRRVAAAMDNGFRDRIRITSPATAMRFCLERFERLAKEAKQEEFHMVTLDTKNQPIASHQITVGTLRNSLVHPREVFRPAIRDAANCILVVHNHPSGDPTPSDQDISVTERLESAAEIIGIPLIDHIVVAGEKALSIQEWRSGNRS